MIWAETLHRLFSHVVVHVTDRCDLACQTCFVKKGRNDLSIESARLIAGKLGRITWLDIGGGEPFLHPGLLSICQAFHTSSITIPTNGQQTQRIVETVRELRRKWKGELTLAVSLDGFEPENDALRGPGTYGRALETYRNLRNIENVAIKISTVVCESNIANLVPFMESVQRELAPDYHSLLLLRGRPASDTCVLPPLDTLEAMTPSIFRIWDAYAYADKNPLRRRFKREYQQYYWRTSLKTLAVQERQVPCKAPYLHRVIYPDGAVAMCELMPPSGSILTEPIHEINRKIRRDFEAYESANGPCFCTHNCNMGENIITHPASVARIVAGDPHV